MSTTTAISRASNLRRTLTRFPLHQWRTTSTFSSSSPPPLPDLPSPFSPSLFHRPLHNTVNFRDRELRPCFSPSLFHRTLHNTVNFGDRELRPWFGSYEKCLSTAATSGGSGDGAGSSTAAEVKISSSSSNSGGNGGSDAGKPIRGSVNFRDRDLRPWFGPYGKCLSTVATSGGSSDGAGTSTAAEAKISSECSNSGGDGGGESRGSHQSGGDAGKSVRGSPVSWMSFFLLLVTGAGLVYYYDREKKKHIEEISNSSNAVRQGPSVGQAAIGGPFSLVNHEGKKVTDKDFLGKWTLLYFGFTHCPDICPDELIKLSAAIDKIKEKSGLEIVPVFISVDPERDTVEQVSEYVKEFHPKLIGLTGDPEEIRKVARAYRVYYMKTTEEGSDYLVDHSIVMYLMSPEMKFVKFFGKNTDVDGLANGIIREVKQYKK